MDFRRPGNPFPFSGEWLRIDDAPLSEGERKELLHLMHQAARLSSVLRRRPGQRETERGQAWRDLEMIAGYVERARQALMTAHQRETAGQEPAGLEGR
jgi:hypothetical protein